MDPLRTAIFATILYYDSFNFPLTLAEVYRYLINPNRLSNKDQGISEISPAEISKELETLVRLNRVGHKNGFYFMPGREELYTSRMEKDKLAAKKWKKFLSTVKYLQAAPYLRVAFASGSLAANNPEPESDFDIFIIIRSGRLYTGRLFLWLIASALGARRGRFDVVASDKFCFNHYLTDGEMELSHRSLFIAQLLANMKPVIVSGRTSRGILEKFFASNKWVNSYCYNFRPTLSYRAVRPNKFMLILAKTGELILNTAIGNLTENILKAFQQKRIKNNPITYESGGRIIFTDKELEFHPRSFEGVVIDRYNKGLQKSGVLGVEEKDSGLGKG